MKLIVWIFRKKIEIYNLNILSIILAFWRSVISKILIFHDFAHFSKGYKRYLDMFSWNFKNPKNFPKHILKTLWTHILSYLTSNLGLIQNIPRNFGFSGFPYINLLRTISLRILYREIRKIRKFRGIFWIIPRSEVIYIKNPNRNFFYMCLGKFFGFLKFHENISKYRL